MIATKYMNPLAIGVGWDAYIEVRGNRYSVPANHCGEPVTIRISLDGELSVYSGNDELLARHRLQDRREGWQRVAEHHEALWRAVSAVEQRALSAYEAVLR